MSESTVRSLVKTLSWRVTGSTATLVVSYLISGNLMMAASIAGIQFLANTVLYFIHERVWNNIKWGRNNA